MTRALPRPMRRAVALAAAATMLLLAGCSGGPEASGERIKGTSSSTGAPTLPTGDSWDELGEAGTDAGVRVYAVEREQTEQGITVSANVQVGSGATEGITVSLTTAAGASCATDEEKTTKPGDAALLSATVGSDRGDFGDCVKTQRLLVTLTRAEGVQGTAQVRLRLSRLTPAKPSDFERPPFTTPSNDVQIGATEKGSPGQWLSDAQTLDPTRTVSGEVPVGTLHSYRVAGVKWGQSISFRVVHPAAPPSLVNQIRDAGIQGQVLLVSPTGKVTQSQSVMLGDDGAGTQLVTSTVVGLNGDNDRPGDYTIIVSATSGKQTGAKLPYQLVATVTGDENTAYGPPVGMTTTHSGGLVPEPLLWTMLVLGVAMIVVGMTQVTLHRQR